MTRATRFIWSVAAVLAALVGPFAWQAGPNANSTPTVSSSGASSPRAADSGYERHHYSLAARVRPLVLFWISRSNVGDAVMTRARDRAVLDAATYTLLIGSDPDRAPFHINRWGYIEEEIHGAEARLIGLMTESDEESVEDAEATVRRPSSAHHSYKVIQGTADGEQSLSHVMSMALPEDYTLHQMRTVLDLAQRDWSGAKSRAVPLPPGARPGFLAALADAMHTASAKSITFVYYGRLYELRRTRTETVPNLRIGRMTYGPAVATDFLITSTYDGEQTRFSMTYGTRDPFAEVPLRVMFQPRWWMQVELTIDDASEAPSSSEGGGQ
ncbi:MAG TPA: hypothetical protein VNZ26_02675 [Vicinamibacterales bacterium]|nr:hypothetical protein [Vicinamibacterales bacterium]